MKLSQFRTNLRHLSFGLGVFLLFSCQEEIASGEVSDESSIESNSKLTPYKLGAFQFDSLNLNTIKFLNGDPIERAQSEAVWKKAAENKSPAYCLAGEDSSVLLYNFYALTDSRGIIEKNRLLTLSDAQQMAKSGKASMYFSKKEPTVERSYTGKFYDLELINWWVVADNDSACVMCWKPDGSEMKLQQASRANGFCVRPLKK